MTARLLLCLVGLSACGAPTSPEAEPKPSSSASPSPSFAPAVDAPTPVPDAKAPEPSPPPSVATQSETLVTTMESLAALHSTHATDCSQLGQALQTFATEHATVVSAQTPQIHAHIDGAAPLRDRLVTAMDAVMSGGMRCRDDAVVKAAYATLGK